MDWFECSKCGESYDTYEQAVTCAMGDAASGN